MFSRPAKALRAAWELGSELCTAIEARRGAVHPLHSFTEAMEMFRVVGVTHTNEREARIHTSRRRRGERPEV